MPKKVKTLRLPGKYFEYANLPRRYQVGRWQKVFIYLTDIESEKESSVVAYENISQKLICEEFRILYFWFLWFRTTA